MSDVAWKMPPSGRFRKCMIDSLEVHRWIAARLENWLHTLFPERRIRRDGPHGFRVGKRGSLAVRSENGRVVFFDHEAGAGGDAIDLWAREQGVTTAEALRLAAQWAGMDSARSNPLPTPRAKAQPRPMKINVEDLLTPPNELRAMMREGREWLWQPQPGARGETWNEAAIADLAEWRGWRAVDVKALVRDGFLFAPVIFGERARAAFPVSVPHPMPERMPGDRQRLVGLHARLHDRQDEMRGWRFWPSEHSHGYRLPPLPLVLTGAAGIASARLLMITEGEWDALSFALAAGWLGDEKRGLPQGVAAIGLRGVSSWQDFFAAFAPYWPRGVDVLVLRDADQAGARWLVDFLPALRVRCGRVESVTLGGCKDANAALCAGLLNRESCNDLLGVVGWTLAKAESAGPQVLSPGTRP